jgi:hypothetical protein
MKRALFLLIVLSGCATIRPSYKLVEGAEKSPLWVCVPDPNEKGAILCEDFEKAVRFIFKPQDTVTDQL